MSNKSRRQSSNSRKIISNPYDSDSDISFVQPYGDKKAVVTTQTLLNRISSNATEITNDLSKLVVHATTKIENFVDETFVASDDDDDGSDKKGGHSRKASHLKKKAMDLILEQTGKCVDHTGHCAATLHHVVNEIPNPCLELVVRSDDESSDDDDENSRYRGKRRTRKTKKKKKKRSEAKAHSGILSDGISVTTDEKTEYSSDDDDDSLTFVDDSAERRRVATLQRRRAQFLRQRAIERTAEMDEDEKEESQYDHPKLTDGFKLTKMSAFPSQELRVPSQELRCDDDLDKVDISSLTDIRDLRDPSDKSFDSTKAAWSPELFEKDPFSSAPDVDTTAEDSLLNSSNELECEILKPSPKWSSFSAEFPKLDDNSSHNLVLKESHLGATLANTPTIQSGLQLGDVIIRLNQDVSTLDTSTVSDMINEMRDSRRITYLRKNVEL